MCPVSRRIGDHQPTATAPERARIVCDDGRTALIVDGVVQSIDIESATSSDYWSAMLPDTRPEQTLLLGAGG
ncbi:MAG: hypothetical protein AB7N70_16110, partial [Dehalococcoidia bacterium]